MDAFKAFIQNDCSLLRKKWQEIRLANQDKVMHMSWVRVSGSTDLPVFIDNQAEFTGESFFLARVMQFTLFKILWTLNIDFCDVNNAQ